MHKSSISFTLEAFNQLFGLPEGVEIVGIKEGHTFGQVHFRVISKNEPPKSFNIDINNIKQVGYAYGHPEDFQEDLNKGSVRDNEVKEPEAAKETEVAPEQNLE